VNIPPKITLTKLINSLKAVSSRPMRQESPELTRHYYRTNKLRSGSYFARSAGGAPLSTMHQYIEQQNQPGQNTIAPQRALPHRPPPPA
jgi:putative transposase